MSQRHRRVLINGRFLTQRITGVQRVAINLVLSLDKLIGEVHPSFEVQLVTPKTSLNPIDLKNIRIVSTGRFQGHPWEQFDLSRYAGDDLLINLCNTAPLFKRNQFVFIHDAAVFRFPQAYRRTFVAWYKIIGRSVRSNARKIFTVSEFSKNEIVTFLKADPAKVFVIHPGITLNTNSDNDTILQKLNVTPRQYFLTVGSHDPRKNLAALIAAFDSLNIRGVDLVIVGSANSEVFRQVHLTTSERIKVTGYVDDAELTSLYRNAKAFVYPSLYEGFGLPPLEAMLCNCPVVSSKIASLGEVCGDAALYFDPYQPGAIEKAIKEFQSSPGLAGTLVEKGKKQVSKFSYESSAKRLWQHIIE